MSLTFSKNDLSPFSGEGVKLSLSFIDSKKSFCSLFNILGVHTFTWTNKSPAPYELTLDIPFPLNLRIFPDWIPDSSLILTFPVTVSISLETPRTASEMLIYRS